VLSDILSIFIAYFVDFLRHEQIFLLTYLPIPLNAKTYIGRKINLLETGVILGAG